MYNVPVGPSKIASKSRRRGLNQNQSMDRKDSQRNKKPVDSTVPVSTPRPTFNTKDSHKKKEQAAHEKPPTAESAHSPEYGEVVRFATDTWNAVWDDYQEHVRNNTTGPDTVMYYEEKAPCKALENFKPFDLEAFWGKRLFENITKNTPANNEVP